MILIMDFDMFFQILIFEPKLGSCKGYNLCMMAHFENGVIFGIFCVFLERFFAQNNSK